MLQRVVMPPRRELSRLYCRLNRSLSETRLRPRRCGRRTLRLPRCRVLRTDTWFNGFFEHSWRRYTLLSRLVLQVRVSGAGVLWLYRRCADDEPKLVQEVNFAGSNRTLRIEVPAPAATDSSSLLYFAMGACSSRLVLHQAEWLAVDTVPRPMRLAVVFCTFNRAPLLLRTLAALFADADIAGVLERVIVVDQGSEKVRDHPEFAEVMRTAAGRLHLVEQENYGGSGGFTRGLLEARNASDAGHVLLMDDDAGVEPEAILRAAAFLSLARRDVAVGGHMLDQDRPCELVEAGSRYLAEQLRIDEPVRRRVERADDLAPFLEPPARHYNGWWFLAFPLAVLDRVGLPLPLFLRGDDLEFGCRLLRAGVPTVALPGVAVWHEAIERKARGWHPFYETRNQMITGAVYFPGVGAATAARRFFSRLLDELLAYDYAEAWLQCEAAAAFLRGPQALRRPPWSVHHALQTTHARLAAAVQPRDRSLPAICCRPPAIGCWRTRLWRGRLVLRNLLLPSPSPHARPQSLLPGSGEQWYDVAGADVIAVEGPQRDRILVLRRSRGRFVRLLLRGLRLAVTLFVLHRRTVRGWRGGVPELMSRAFWRSYLRLSSAGVAREDALGVRERGDHAEDQGSLLQLGRF